MSEIYLLADLLAGIALIIAVVAFINVLGVAKEIRRSESLAAIREREWKEYDRNFPDDPIVKRRKARAERT
jgi:hypothetical protein